MASSGSQDPLDVLQLMVNEVLVQTGKALRASRKDGLGNVAQAHGSLQNKLPDTIRTFHSALDTLEHDIIRAKSVLLRDLTQLQQKRQPVPVSEPKPEPVPQKQQQKVKQEKPYQPSVQQQPVLQPPIQQQSIQQQHVQEQQFQQQPFQQQPFPQQQVQQQQFKKQQSKKQPQHQTPQPQQQQQQQQQLPPPQPQPIESQSKSPMVIDIDSSSPANDPSVMEIKPPPKQMAPFPDMGMGLPDVSQADIQIKKEFTPSVPPENSAPPEDLKVEVKASPAPMAPMPPMAPMVEEKPLDDGMDFTGGDVNPPGSELTFTNMEFTLAPANDDSGNPVATQGQSFDLTAFAPADGGGGGGGGELLSLDLLPPNPQGQPIANPPLQPQPQMQPQETVQQSIENKDDNMDSTFDELFLLGGNGDYGGGGNMEATFDDLMNDRFDDNGFDSMEHGKFDEAFFGLDGNMS